MFPQFQRIVTLSVMSILVGLFTWIYMRDRHPRARLWMTGWACIVVHFAGMLLFSFSLIPARLADWSAYSTLLAAASAFFLSVCQMRFTSVDRALFWGAIVAPALAYWTLMVYEVQSPIVYRLLLVTAITAGAWLALRQPRRLGSLLAWSALAVGPGLWAAGRASTNVETGMDFLLFEGFAITGWTLLAILPPSDAGSITYLARLSGLGVSLSHRRNLRGTAHQHSRRSRSLGSP